MANKANTNRAKGRVPKAERSKGKGETAKKPEKPADKKPPVKKPAEVVEHIPANVHHDPKGIGRQGTGVAEKLAKAAKPEDTAKPVAKTPDKPVTKADKPQVVAATSGGSMNIPTSLGGKRMVITRVAKSAGLDLAEIKALDGQIESQVPLVKDLVTTTLGDRAALESLTPEQQKLVSRKQKDQCAANEAELARMLAGGEDVAVRWQRIAHFNYINWVLDNGDLTSKARIIAALSDLRTKGILIPSGNDSGTLRVDGLAFFTPKDAEGADMFYPEEIKAIQHKLDTMVSAAFELERQEGYAAKEALVSKGNLTTKELLAGKPGKIVLNVSALNNKATNTWYPWSMLLVESDGDFLWLIDVIGSKEDQYRTADKLGMELRLAQLKLGDEMAKPFYPPVTWRISWQRFIKPEQDNRQQDGSKWIREADTMKSRATITPGEFLAGTDGVLYLGIPAILDNGAKRHGGGILISKKGDRVSILEVTPSAAIAPTVQAIINNGAWVSWDALRPWDFGELEPSTSFPYWPSKGNAQWMANFAYSLVKCGLWQIMRVGAQMFWHQVRRGLEEAGSKEKISEEREKLAKRATITPNEFFVEGKDGTTAILFNGSWEDKHGGRQYNDVSALVSREQNSDGKVIILREVPEHLQEFLGACIGKHFPDGDGFKTVDQPLRGILKAALSRAEKLAGIAQP